MEQIKHLILALYLCIQGCAGKQFVECKNPYVDDDWVNIRRHYEHGDIDTSEFLGLVGTIQTLIEVRRLSLDTEEHAIKQYVDERLR